MVRILRDFGLVAVITFVVGYLATNFMEDYSRTILIFCGINVILAVSLNLVNGFTGQFSMGHAGFMAVGAYVSAAFTYYGIPVLLGDVWLTDPGLKDLSLLMATILGGGVAAFVGLLVGIPSLRLRGDYLAIVTLGFGEIIRIVFLNWEAVGGARGFTGIATLTNVYWVIAVSILSVLFIHRIVTSIPGKQFMAVRDDETATLAMGLSTTRIKVRAFVMASFFAGVAGSLMAHYLAYLNPQSFTFDKSFQMIAMVVLGGMGSLSGSVVAAVFLTVLLEKLRDVQNLTGVDFRMVIYALILIVIMLTRPTGLLGTKEIWDLWRSKRKVSS